MTEAQWQTCGYPWGMVLFLEKTASDRKLRLYACGCARWTWGGPPDDRCRAAVKTAERFADGRATAEDLSAAYHPARRVSLEYARRHPGDPRQYPLIAPADATCRSAFAAAHTGSLDAGWSSAGGDWQPDSAGYAALAELVRCVFGNPFRPAVFGSQWRTADVVGLARGIYEDRAFDRLPLLADALTDAGYDGDDILGHCRSEGSHVRGCWVVDLVAGKE